MTATQTSLMVAIPVLLGSLGRLPIGLLSDRYGAKPVLATILLFSVLPAFALSRADSFTGLVMGGFFLGVAGTANILHELKATSVGAGMGAMDVMTLDIVAMLFDQIFDDPKVPNGVKGLIGRMQIPMLKAAIADKSFFSTKTHPARQLLDTLGEIASCLPADFSPAHALFPRLEGILEELVSGYQDNVEIFTAVRERLEALLEEEDQRIEGETRAAAKRVEDMEKLAVAKRAAEGEVRARVELREPPRLVVDFLARQWLKLLLLVHDGPPHLEHRAQAHA